MKRLIVAALFLAGCSSSNTTPAPAAAAAPDPQIAALQASMTELLERMDVMNDRITRLEKANEELKSLLPAGEGARRADEGHASRPSPAAAPHPLPSGEGIMGGYRKALASYGARDWVKARAAFQQVFDADPSGDLADNALFWIGGTYYSSGDYNDAIRYYKRVVDEYGDQNKAPDAMYMLALSYEKTSDLALARTTLQQVIARYPYSAPASSAKEELNRIKY